MTPSAPSVEDAAAAAAEAAVAAERAAAEQVAAVAAAEKAAVEKAAAQAAAAAAATAKQEEERLAALRNRNPVVFLSVSIDGRDSGQIRIEVSVSVVALSRLLAPRFRARPTSSYRDGGKHMSTKKRAGAVADRRRSLVSRWRLDTVVQGPGAADGRELQMPVHRREGPDSQRCHAPLQRLLRPSCNTRAAHSERGHHGTCTCN